MGIGASNGGNGSPAENYTTNDQKMRNQTIEEKLMQEIEDEKKIVKILLLGAGECGKSTILKQMKILHLRGFTIQEKRRYKYLIAANTLQSIQQLCNAMAELSIPFDDNSLDAVSTRVRGLDDSNYAETIQARDDIAALWKDAGLQLAFSRRNEFYLLDNAKYFLSRSTQYLNEDFMPEEQDILRSRITTTGIQETRFSIQGRSFKMYDVGGQRGERKKWIHAFDDATAIMFVAALSEYDQVLAEDRTKNRMEESLDLFETIATMPWFKDSSVILFLNKNDMFEEKIQQVPMCTFFPEFNGELGSYEAALKFVYDEYTDCVPQDKNIYVHVTDATNTENVEFVWKATQHIILDKALTSGEYAMF